MPRILAAIVLVAAAGLAGCGYEESAEAEIEPVAGSATPSDFVPPYVAGAAVPQAATDADLHRDRHSTAMRALRQGCPQGETGIACDLFPAMAAERARLEEILAGLDGLAGPDPKEGEDDASRP